MYVRTTFDFEIRNADGTSTIYRNQTWEQAMALGVPTDLLFQVEVQRALEERQSVPDNRLN